MSSLRFLLDRTAVLFLGVAAGVAMGYAFGSGNGRQETVALAPEAAPVANPPAATAPPPPTGPAAPASEDKQTETPDAVAEVKAPPVVTPPVADHVTPSLAEAANGARPVRVGVFGDSFGDGVWSALYRLLPAGEGYKVTKFSQQSTGFTRYRSLNLETHDDGQIADQPLDVAVVAFGANDVQGVCDAGHCGALMSAYWQQVIANRITSYIAMLRRHGANVYWVGLPVMRDPGFDSDTHAMDAFYAGLMGRLGVPFVEIRPVTADPDGHYQAYYRDADGAEKLLRAGDGIHMSMNGYIRITKDLAGRIRATVGAARKAQPAGDAPDAAEPADNGTS